ncbi:MAG TPA: pyrroline-5-carboxylate reductase [Planctomycetes bacterium]|nr:pyrroline-5-carboxylate reductase [Planctomycetota bacterium]
MDERIGFIGAGAMAEAVAGCLVASGRAPAALLASDPRPDRRERFAALGALVAADDAELAARADTIVLAVPPPAVERALAEIARSLAPGKLVVAAAPGLTAGAVRRFLPEALIVRAAPAAPCLVGNGVSVLCADAAVGAAERERAARIFGACGAVVWVPDERTLELAAAIGAAASAFFFRGGEALTHAAVEAGLPAESAATLVRRMLLGAAALAAAGRDAEGSNAAEEVD